jgi:hypothetical protein
MCGMKKHAPLQVLYEQQRWRCADKLYVMTSVLYYLVALVM